MLSGIMPYIHMYVHTLCYMARLVLVDDAFYVVAMQYQQSK